MRTRKTTGIVVLSFVGIVTIYIFLLNDLISFMDSSWEFIPNVEAIQLKEIRDTDADYWRSHSGTTTKKALYTEEIKVEKVCSVATKSVVYPFCEEKVAYLKTFWKLPCFQIKNNITSGDDLCKILIYLSEVEKWCPPLPWRNQDISRRSAKMEEKKAIIRSSIYGLITQRPFNHPDYRWMKNRIKSMKDDWATAIKNLGKKRPLTERTRKRIIVFLGSFPPKSWMLKNAFSGGPLGELVQWSDIITSLYLLGHDVTVVTSINEMKRFIPPTDKDGCIDITTVQKFAFDLLYVDIVGIQLMAKFVGPNWSEIRCKTRIVDTFGTEAQFNFMKFASKNKKYKSGWGGLEFNLQQFMTMFPHTPDNSFLGFVSGAASKISKTYTYHKEKLGLVYGKKDVYWNITNPRYLDTIHEYVDVHGTFNSSKNAWPSYIPKYVKNHGVIDRVTLENLLQKSKVFVGLGFPFEGPAPLEAIANGAAFLNPKFPDPLNRYNSDFFAMKPTRRLVTSQNPYAEQFIGEPYVYTIDIKNVSEVSRAMEKIMKTELKPYLPYEYTHEGMLERMSAQVEHLEFCTENQWPPLKNMMNVKGKVGQSCKDACWNKGLLCEPSYWEIVNHNTWFKRVGLICEDVKYVESLVAPSYDEKTKICYLQKQPLLYSCVSSSNMQTRLCPCRDFIKGQVALCKDCW